MASGAEVSGQLSSLLVFEAIVTGVDPETHDLFIKENINEEGAPTRIPPIYFGGTSDAGCYQDPEKGDIVLCTRVHPGGHGLTQALRVIPTGDGHRPTSETRQTSTVPTGHSAYPRISEGTVRMMGGGGGEITLDGSPGSTNCNIFVGNPGKSGLYINNSTADKTNLTTVSDSMQSVSTAHRLVSGDAVRTVREIPNEPTGHQLLVYATDTGVTRGLFPGDEASNASFMGDSRNAALSEYRLVMNEVSEASSFRGWDAEASRLGELEPQQFSENNEIRAIIPGNSLHLAPHQLIEVIGGNLINSRGECLDPNYSVVQIGNALGRISKAADVGKAMEEARLISRRGVGYHFQLSTNSVSTAISNDIDNFVFALDKEGVMKLNVPRSSDSGNILYPTNAKFYNETSTGAIETTASQVYFSKEKVPVTLRDENGDPVFPKVLPADQAKPGESTGEEVAERETGIRYTNDNSYFQGIGASTDGADGVNVRVHPTRYHNMYAAAEMLIANKIDKVIIPFTNGKCTGYIPDNSVGKPFERESKDIDPDGTDATEVVYMAVVGVTPSPPAIDPGGGVFVAGKDYTQPTNDDDEAINVQYTNSFTVGKDSRNNYLPTNVTEEGSARRNPGGKSANLNFEGAVEASVGSDNNDGKSLMLDTAGSLIAWFGADSAGRSMVMQTDGDVLLNVGGANGNEWNEGRFDLRVNVTDGKFVGEEQSSDEKNSSDYIISISKHGLVIAGMKRSAPMIIRNDGNVMIESTAKLILQGQSVEVREGNRPPRKTYKDPVSTDTPDASPEGVPATIKCLLKELGEAAE